MRAPSYALEALVIDLHSHILPGLDDGAGDSEMSLAMARVAVDDGIRTIVATPHVNDAYNVDLEAIGRLAGELNVLFARAEIPLAVLAGAELAMTRVADMTDVDLTAASLGSGSSVLIESPYAPTLAFLDELLFDLQVRGFRPVLAHPERCPAFQRDIDRLSQLVQRGVLCSVNAGSMAGMFGTRVRRFVLQLLREGLVHDVASDAHDPVRRPPALRLGFDRANSDLPGLAMQLGWFTDAAPAAILAGEPLPPRPEPPPRKPSGWRRVVRR